MKGEVFEFFFSLRDSDAQFDMGTAEHGGASSWTARYVTVLSQARWLVLASWALLSVLAAWQGPLFLSECVMRMPPETWTRSARGRAVVSAAFPEREGKEILALLLASNDGSAVTTPAVAEFTRRLSAVALDFAPRYARPGGDGGAQQLELVAFGAAGRVHTRGAARF